MDSKKSDHYFGWSGVFLQLVLTLVIVVTASSASSWGVGTNSEQAGILPKTVAAASAAPSGKHSSTNHLGAKNGDDRNVLPVEHVKSPDIHLIDRAFEYGYPANLINVNTGTERLPTLTINNNGKKHSDQDFFSVWTRDLYWGFLGWAQAGDDSVLKVMKSSLRLLILAKNRESGAGTKQDVASE